MPRGKRPSPLTPLKSGAPELPLPPPAPVAGGDSSSTLSAYGRANAASAAADDGDIDEPGNASSQASYSSGPRSSTSPNSLRARPFPSAASSKPHPPRQQGSYRQGAAGAGSGGGGPNAASPKGPPNPHLRRSSTHTSSVSLNQLAQHQQWSGAGAALGNGSSNNVALRRSLTDGLEGSFNSGVGGGGVHMQPTYSAQHAQQQWRRARQQQQQQQQHQHLALRGYYARSMDSVLDASSVAGASPVSGQSPPAFPTGGYATLQPHPHGGGGPFGSSLGQDAAVHLSPVSAAQWGVFGGHSPTVGGAGESRMTVIRPHPAGGGDAYDGAGSNAPSASGGLSVGANDDKAQVRVEGYFDQFEGVLIPSDLPRSTVLYVLTASDGRDLLFKVVQYTLQLNICFLSMERLFSPESAGFTQPLALRFWKNYNTIRHGRSLFKMGRGLLNFFTVGTVLERLWLKHGDGIKRRLLLPCWESNSLAARALRGLLLQPLGLTPPPHLPSSVAALTTESLNNSFFFAQQRRLRAEEAENLLADDMYQQPSSVEQLPSHLHDARGSLTNANVSSTANNSGPVSTTDARTPAFPLGASPTSLVATHPNTNNNNNNNAEGRPRGSSREELLHSPPQLATSPTALPSPLLQSVPKEEGEGEGETPSRLNMGDDAAATDVHHHDDANIHSHRSANARSLAFPPSMPDGCTPALLSFTLPDNSCGPNTTTSGSGGAGNGSQPPTLLKPIPTSALGAVDGNDAADAAGATAATTDSQNVGSANSLLSPTEEGRKGDGGNTAGNGGGGADYLRTIKTVRFDDHLVEDLVRQQQEQQRARRKDTLAASGSGAALSDVGGSACERRRMPGRNRVESTNALFMEELDFQHPEWAYGDASTAHHDALARDNEDKGSEALHSTSSANAYGDSDVSFDSGDDSAAVVVAGDSSDDNNTSARDGDAATQLRQRRRRRRRLQDSLNRQRNSAAGSAPYDSQNLVSAEGEAAGENDCNNSNVVDDGASTAVDLRELLQGDDDVPAELARPEHWLKAPTDFSTPLMLLLGTRNFLAGIRRFTRDVMLVSAERFFAMPAVERHRARIHRASNHLWLAVSAIDLLLNTLRLAKLGWVKYAAARQNIRCRCGCRGAEDPEDMVWRANGLLTRRKANLFFPPLNLDYGAPFASNITYFEAADPEHMMPACSRCGCIYREPPESAATRSGTPEQRKPRWLQMYDEEVLRANSVLLPAMPSGSQDAVAATTTAGGSGSGNSNRSPTAPTADSTAGDAALSSAEFPVSTIEVKTAPPSPQAVRGGSGTFPAASLPSSSGTATDDNDDEGKTKHTGAFAATSVDNRASVVSAAATTEEVAAAAAAAASAAAAANGNNDNSNAKSAEVADDATLVKSLTPQPKEGGVDFLLLPWLMRRLFNYVWLLRVHPNWTSALLLQARYLAELYLSYKFCFGGYESGQRDAPMKAILHPDMAVAGIISAAVGLMRVIQSAPK